MKDKFLCSIIGLVIMAMIAFGVALYFYFNMFNGELSKQSNEWANFGSYLGGVITPLISFFALIALLASLWLQKKEFSAIIAGQNSAAGQLKAQLHASLLNNHKQTLLKFLSDYAYTQSISQRYSILPSDPSADTVTQSAMRAVLPDLQREHSNSAITLAISVNQIAKSIVTTKFATIEELDNHFNERWKHLIGDK